MKRLALFCGVMLLLAGIASAQDSPKIEIFGGYSYFRLNPGAGAAPSENFNGGSGSFAYNFTPIFGGVADIGAYHWSHAGTGVNVQTFLCGPKVALRHGPITPFAQALFGGAHASALGTSATTFAMALGGGLDWNFKTHIGIRLMQAEYLLTRFNSVAQNNIRISTGVVFRW